MKLIELLELINEHNSVWIFNSDGEMLLATYNGRDSIPNELNEREIISISSGYESFFIRVKDGV